MSTELTTPKTFEQKMKDRIRESIGELMSDDDLKKILERGVEEALFQRRIVPDGSRGWGNHTKEIPSVVDSAVTELLGKKMREAVDAWLAANPDRISEAVQTAVTLGVGQCMIAALDSKVNSALYQFRGEIEQRLRE